MNRYYEVVCACGSKKVYEIEDGIYECEACGEFFEDDTFEPHSPMFRKIKVQDDD